MSVSLHVATTVVKGHESTAMVCSNWKTSPEQTFSHCCPMLGSVGVSKFMWLLWDVMVSLNVLGCAINGKLAKYREP